MSEQTFQSPFLQEAQARGFIYQGTDMAELDALMAKESIAAYIGFDPTASSLHVGNFLQIMLLRMLQKHGHTPIVLVGGGTGRVGDPSGKDSQRQMMTDEVINGNISGIKAVLSRFIDFSDSCPNKAIMVDNNDWLAGINYLDFLREYGPHFTINRMLTFESVKARLDREQPLTFLEFNYMLLQGYDFEQLFLKHKCRLELGGSDQWGNIICGVELVRRRQNARVYGLTSPLVTTASGAKMGKSAQGAVWLDADKYEVFDFWQFWRNTDDADVGRFLRFFTELPFAEIARLEALEGAEINQAKVVLANELTALCHGKEAAEKACAAAESQFGSGDSAAGLPTFSVSQEKFRAGMTVISLLVENKLCASNGEVRRLIKGGGVKINDQPVADGEKLLGDEALIDNTIKVSLGKKRHYLFVIE